MEIVNSLIEFFGFNSIIFDESMTFIDFVFSMSKIFIGVWLVIFIISSMFRLIGYICNKGILS